MADEEDRALLIQVCNGRTAMFNMLAGLYFEPLSTDEIETMAQTDLRQYSADNELIESGFNDITRFLRKRHSGTQQMLAVDYTSSFGGTKSYKGKVSVPYASVFLSESGLLNQEPRNKVYFAYREEQLAVSNKSIPADHLSFELEFMGILSERASKALEVGDDGRALELFQMSKDFLNEHVLTWFPLLKDLALHIITTRFYRGVLDVTQGYFELDLEVLDELISKVEDSHESSDNEQNDGAEG